MSTKRKEEEKKSASTEKSPLDRLRPKLKKKIGELLLPKPKKLSFGAETLTFSNRLTVAIPPYFPGRERLITSIQEIFKTFYELKIEIVANSPGIEPDEGEVFLILNPLESSLSGPESYRLKVDPRGKIELSSPTDKGLFRGATTLLQIVKICSSIVRELPTAEQNELFGGQPAKISLTSGQVPIPELNISDWPDFPHRGFMLDISRDKVPKLETLFYLIDHLALFKINQLQLYTEHTFAYRGYRYVWEDSSPLTPEDIIHLQDYCRKRYIELVPNQNSFGHLHRWLKHPQLSDLAEVPEGIEHPFGRGKEPYSLCPTDPRSLEFLEELYSQLLPLFESRAVNIGFDETFDVGTGRSKEAVQSEGVGAVYLEFFQKVYKLVKHWGKTPQLWADIVLKHPEVLPKFPKDSTLLIWGYEAEHPFDEQCQKVWEAGLPFYVCPGTSSWNSWAGRSENAILNLYNAAISGKKWGADGYLITDWGDFGHQQPLFASFLGLAAGAGFSWNVKGYGRKVLQNPWGKYLNMWFFDGQTDVLGDIIFQLGELYKLPGGSVFNASPLFRLFILWRKHSPRRYGALTLKGVLRAAAKAQAMRYEVEEELVKLRRKFPPEAKIRQIAEDMKWAAGLIQLAGEFIAERWKGEDKVERIPPKRREDLRKRLRELIEIYRERWHYWNRPGGFEDSKSYLEEIYSALKPTD